LGCSPIKAIRELGSERRKTVWSLSTAGARPAPILLLLSMWSVYILHNPRRITKNFYIGLTNKIAERFKEHKNGKVYFTRKDRLDWELVYFETFASKQDAVRREQRLKQHGQAFRQLKERIHYSLLSGIRVVK